MRHNNGRRRAASAPKSTGRQGMVRTRGRAVPAVVDVERELSARHEAELFAERLRDEDAAELVQGDGHGRRMRVRATVEP